MCNRKNINCKILNLGEIKKKNSKTPKKWAERSIHAHKRRFRELVKEICSTSLVIK